MTQKCRYTWSGSVPGPIMPFWESSPAFFIEIPKTGSLSIQRARNPQLSFGHIYGRYFPEHVRHKLYTIVRNPYDRLVSAYFFMIRGGFNNNAHYLEIRDNYDSFQDWVLHGLSAELTRWNPAYWDMEPTIAQVEWLIDPSTGSKLILPPENIGRFETLDADVDRLLGIKALPHINKSTDRKHWTEYYQDPRVANKVYRLYKQDFDLLGYPKYTPQNLPRRSQ